MTSLLFSYSHRDESFRDELEVHLAALKRQGVIETWHDRRIVAGDEVHNEIGEHLENDDIILLLVSPYFIASDYCYDVEMKRAMERHNSGEAHVIPVILHPCDWESLPFGQLLATPTDGRPISKFPNQHDAFLEVTKAIRAAAEKLGATQGRGGREAAKGSSVDGTSNPTSELPRPSKTREIRSSNLRVKKQFTDHEKDRFADEAFEYIANYFEESLAELERRNPEVQTRFRKNDASYFTAAIYTNGSLASSCRIWVQEGPFSGGIAYSIGEGGGNGFNESLSVDDDGYTLFLKPLGMFIRDRDDQQLTYEGGAERYWDKLMELLQR